MVVCNCGLSDLFEFKTLTFIRIFTQLEHKIDAFTKTFLKCLNKINLRSFLLYKINKPS